MRLGYKLFLLSAATATLAACATKAPPPPPVRTVAVPPPVAIPPRPRPPGGAAITMQVPPIGIDGVRETPNRILSADESIWHFRSAINVAALTCGGVVWDPIATNYNSFIKVHKTRLAKASKAVDAEYKARYPGQNGLRVRDGKMTDLYNYFALPPVKQQFCDMALAKSQEAVALPVGALPEYSVGALKDIDAIYLRFFDAFVQYKTDVALWDQRYAPPAAIVTPNPAVPIPVPAPAKPAG
jgi:hypothetical protein